MNVGRTITDKNKNYLFLPSLDAPLLPLFSDSPSQEH